MSEGAREKKREAARRQERRDPAQPRPQAPPPGRTHQQAVLRHGDAAGLHLEPHALADAGGKSVRLPGPLAPVPAGTPAIDTDAQGE